MRDVLDDGFDEKVDRTAIEAARRKFSPEFMNRIDKVVVFKTLRLEHLRRILDIELSSVQRRVLSAPGTNKFVFNCTESVKSFLLAQGTDPKYGARHLKRAIERNIVFPLANLVASAQLKFGDVVRIDLSPNGRITFMKEAEGALSLSLLERHENEGRPPAWAAAEVWAVA
jgi:ATP-dependent Clp protease ATP-binding subunit ClpA